MPRVQERSLKPIADDLDPKGGTVAWYDVTDPKLTYADEAGENPAEPTALIPIPDPDNPGDWIMVELWTTPENYKKHFGDTYKRLEGADTVGAYVVKERKEWDDLQNRNEELEEENEQLRKRPSSGGKKERHAYGTGTPRQETKHIRMWNLHEEFGGKGELLAKQGRIPGDIQKAYNKWKSEENGGKDYKPTTEDLQAWKDAYGTDGTEDGAPREEIPFDGEHGSDSEREALEKVRSSGSAPEDEEEPEEDYSDDQIKAVLKQNNIRFGKELTDAKRMEGIKLLVAAGS